MNQDQHDPYPTEEEVKRALCVIYEAFGLNSINHSTGASACMSMVLTFLNASRVSERGINQVLEAVAAAQSEIYIHAMKVIK